MARETVDKRLTQVGHGLLQIREVDIYSEITFTRTIEHVYYLVILECLESTRRMSQNLDIFVASRYKQRGKGFRRSDRTRTRNEFP